VCGLESRLEVLAPPGEGGKGRRLGYVLTGEKGARVNHASPGAHN